MKARASDAAVVRSWVAVFVVVLLQTGAAMSGLSGRALVLVLLAGSLAASSIVVLELMHVRHARCAWERAAVGLALVFIALLAASLPDSNRLARLRDANAGGGERGVETR